MRIIGGRFRGKRLAAPGAAGGGAAHLRPTADRVREALFNLLAHGGYGDPAPPMGCRILDLFAGTGALGLEALSRGAIGAVFVDNGAAAQRLIRENIGLLDVGGIAKIWPRDVGRLGPWREAPFDLVFADPPYGSGLGALALASAHGGGWLAEGALVVVEQGAGETIPEYQGMHLCDQRRYGETQLLILRHRS